MRGKEELESNAIHEVAKDLVFVVAGSIFDEVAGREHAKTDLERLSRRFFPVHFEIGFRAQLVARCSGRVNKRRTCRGVRLSGSAVPSVFLVFQPARRIANLNVPVLFRLVAYGQHCVSHVLPRKQIHEAIELVIGRVQVVECSNLVCA